tara:strand:+ start:132 stop:437 length:306 start_codon:yes stop_codon:yes gene_type:complete
MSKWIIFKDAVNDEHAYPIENINAMFITSSSNITVYARNPVQPTEAVSDDTIALTVTSTAGVVADTLDLLLEDISKGTNNLIKVSSTHYNGITTVAYTAGA